jgi:hypothetical protein
MEAFLFRAGLPNARRFEYVFVRLSHPFVREIFWFGRNPLVFLGVLR